jgi:hypothetical protein
MVTRPFLAGAGKPPGEQRDAQGQRRRLGRVNINRNCWLSWIGNGAIVSASSALGAPADQSRSAIRKTTDKAAEPEMRAEYDFFHGIRGKYAWRFARR